MGWECLWDDSVLCVTEVTTLFLFFFFLLIYFTSWKKLNTSFFWHHMKKANEVLWDLWYDDVIFLHNSCFLYMKCPVNVKLTSEAMLSSEHFIIFFIDHNNMIITHAKFNYLLKSQRFTWVYQLSGLKHPGSLTMPQSKEKKKKTFQDLHMFIVEGRVQATGLPMSLSWRNDRSLLSHNFSASSLSMNN